MASIASLARTAGARRAAAIPALAAILVAVVSAAAVSPAAAQDDPTRGRLLYETHCIACHTTQMHWRDQRLARDWAGLEQQVRRWQGRASLNWSDEDVLEVVRHLNDRIYRYPVPLPPRSARPVPADTTAMAQPR